MTNVDMIIGDWLTKLRKSRKYSQRQAAYKYGVSKSTIHCWETGKRALSAYDLIGYSDMLGGDLAELAEVIRNARI